MKTKITLTEEEIKLLKSLPEATPVLRGKDAERFLKKFNETNKKYEGRKKFENAFKKYIKNLDAVLNPDEVNSMLDVFTAGWNASRKATLEIISEIYDKTIMSIIKNKKR